MADDLQDFFDASDQWLETADHASSVPPPPPSQRSRRQIRQDREQSRRKKVIELWAAIAAVIVVIACVIVVSNYAGKLSHRIQATKSTVADWPGPGNGSVEFSVQSGQGADIIAHNLTQAEVVKSSQAFVQALENEGAAGKIQPGTFQLKKHMKAADVVTILTNPKNASGFLEVRAGDRSRDVIERAALISGVSKADFEAIVNNHGSGILPSEAHGSFEGWMEPGSYNVKEMKSARTILQTLVDKRIEKLNSLGVAQGEERERILNIASITEAEVNRPEYYGKVVRVIDNRLQKGMTLGMDSTVAYSKNVSALKLTNDMLNDSSDPYNTRVRQGLPPTPIGNAGDLAIRAASNPEPGDWIYFVTVNLTSGETKFTSSEGEFNEYVKEYKKWESEHSTY
ncbi:endolytic transglycosylase MltG [Bombiscardovia coagulans]|uniref:Endolytic murein transglycosylase n=1 Tax=Bombiscardovia coagulans TaxID=686666 RepID=A0A261ESY7_9BIFI|nr:endolytic transglycosylase MltG [Bombiscardovia coagulans]OZG49970.1 YceG-like family [Bombiscardovia coagulans]